MAVRTRRRFWIAVASLTLVLQFGCSTGESNNSKNAGASTAGTTDGNQEPPNGVTTANGTGDGGAGDDGGSAGEGFGTGGDSVYGNDGFQVVETQDVYPYRQNSPYAGVLKNCVLINTIAESCAVATLPFIGDGVTQPTIDEIMDRVLVTHNWMGERFESMLQSAPDDLIKLFSSTTSILIGSKVRPSFYINTTGGIQLDPDYLWGSVAEKRSVSLEEDFRAGFGNDLKFYFISSFRKASGDRLFRGYNLDDDSIRPVEDIRLPLFRLLFHELAHATDFMPRHKIASIDTSMSIYQATEFIRSEWLSNVLYAQTPLINNQMFDFAQVRFRGSTATAAQSQTTPAQMGQYMATDGAVQFYSYTSQYEDISQLATAVMMEYHFGGFSNVGFTVKPTFEGFTCADLTVGWGRRNRIADPMVINRARIATDLIVGLTPELEQHLANYASAADPMTEGVGWCDNQAQSTGIQADTLSRTGAEFKATSEPTSGPVFEQEIEREREPHGGSVTFIH